MQEDLTLTLGNDAQVVLKRIIGKKLDNSMWILRNKKEKDITDIDLLKERIEIYQKLLTDLGFEEMPDEINEEDAD